MFGEDAVKQFARPGEHLLVANALRGDGLSHWAMAKSAAVELAPYSGAPRVVGTIQSPVSQVLTRVVCAPADATAWSARKAPQIALNNSAGAAFMRSMPETRSH